MFHASLFAVVPYPLSLTCPRPLPFPFEHLPRRLFRHFLNESPVNRLSTQQELKDIKQPLKSIGGVNSTLMILSNRHYF